MTYKELIRAIVAMLQHKDGDIRLAQNPRRPYNGAMSNQSPPEFQGDPIQPSPALLRQIAQAVKDSNVPVDSTVAQWAAAFINQYPNP